MSAVIAEPDALQFEQPTLPPAEPCVVVIFGATGDLTRRKLMPALCRLTNEGCLESVRILGIGRNAAYEGARRGAFPTIKIGKSVRAPKALIDRMLGIGGEAA